ncbi:DENN domain-containing protein 1B-like [Daktulosphaira vitifoliae]|uniref:DENN domain-containing protein 1B-like n=1 Tax=Daktulosphaira vitifoliae TaxID=58002 RepID=UPI0021A9B349|nr:DENN domain-containing protein 1B-like [Daktulosphaira vitifoliae]XP_050544184.1 DENN domain-containing protein 1B-like [Daktulosphaira vitifoliae]
MGSRIKNDVTHLFECFCEVVGPSNEVQEPWILQKFPEHYKTDDVLSSVPKFAYPCEFDRSVVQHYSFVLTSIESKWTFGFCRHDPKSETALVVLSYLPWHESFYKFLNCISSLTNSSKSKDLWSFLENVYNSKLPIKGCDLRVTNDKGDEIFICQSPIHFQLPSIPENRNLTEYYNAVESQNMIIIFASMLFERRIIFTSKKLYRLSSCVQAANAILYPMNWQHIFIPVLPRSLIDYLLAPMPYLIGLPQSLLQGFRQNELGEVVILDADNNTVESPFNDVEQLPTDLVSNLKRQLRNRGSLLGDGVSRAFLRTLVQLIGGYRDALKFHQGELITFNKEAFIESRPTNMQPFLRKMLELQIFQQFIEERLEMLNAGLGFSDEFEMEVCNYHDKTSNKLKQQYKEWSYTVKREGTALFKSVKNVANPAVRNAVKTVKERGRDVRLAYKGLRSKLYVQNKNPRTMINTQPNSAPNSPSAQRKPSRPHTTAFTTTSNNTHKEIKNGIQHMSVTQNMLSDIPGSPPLQLNMDLMMDLHDVIFSKFPKNNTSSLVDYDGNSNECENSNEMDEDVFNTSFGSVSNICPMETKDLIQLDSTSSNSIDDFDPLKSTTNDVVVPVVGLSNPLYQYFEPISKKSSETKKTNDLLNEYGLNFDTLSLSSEPGPSITNHTSITLPPKPANFKSNWTRFE